MPLKYDAICHHIECCFEDEENIAKCIVLLQITCNFMWFASGSWKMLIAFKIIMKTFTLYCELTVAEWQSAQKNDKLND